MHHLLLDPVATQLVLVTLPEELPVIETEDTLEYLRSESLIGNHRVIANRVLPELLSAAVGSGAAAEAAALHRSLFSEQQEWLRRLPPERTLPYLFGLLTPGEVAARLADEMDRQ
jgi:anion-transporting  ArsA/GET3 family ATPase